MLDKDKAVQIFTELIASTLNPHYNDAIHMKYCYYGDRARFDQAHDTGISGALLKQSHDSP